MAINCIMKKFKEFW